MNKPEVAAYSYSDSRPVLTDKSPTARDAGDELTKPEFSFKKHSQRKETSMSTISSISANPFALMLSPRQVRLAMHRSEGLRQLQQRAFYLMDKPRPNGDAELAAFDAALDRAMPWQAPVPVPSETSAQHEFQ